MCHLFLFPTVCEKTFLDNWLIRHWFVVLPHSVLTFFWKKNKALFCIKISKTLRHFFTKKESMKKNLCWALLCFMQYPPEKWTFLFWQILEQCLKPEKKWNIKPEKNEILILPNNVVSWNKTYVASQVCVLLCIPSYEL